MAIYNVSDFNTLKFKCEQLEDSSEFCEYPFELPKVYLHGEEVKDHKFPIFDQENDSVILVRNKCVLEYMSSWYREVLLQNSDGKTEWVAANVIENEEYGDMNFLDEVRAVNQYTITTYDIEKREKRTCSVVLGESSPMTKQDCYRLSSVVDKEVLGNCFEIEDTKDFKGFCF